MLLAVSHCAYKLREAMARLVTSSERPIFCDCRYVPIRQAHLDPKTAEEATDELLPKTPSCQYRTGLRNPIRRDRKEATANKAKEWTVHRKMDTYIRNTNVITISYFLFSTYGVHVVERQ